VLGDLADLARQAVTAGGYPGIFAAMFAETVFPPIPSELVLPLAGFEASRGSLQFVATVLAATAGSLVGAWALYALGRFGGRPAALRWGRILRVTAADLQRSEGWFDRWGRWVVLVGRFVPLARSIVSIPAGMMRMRLGEFSLLTALGSLVWNVVLAGAGYQLGSRWEEVSRVASRYSDVAAAGVVVLLAAGLFWLVRRRARRGASRSD
jgi:membrane protein DedA with SNARE-associated domain